MISDSLAILLIKHESGSTSCSSRTQHVHHAGIWYNGRENAVLRSFFFFLKVVKLATHTKKKKDLEDLYFDDTIEDDGKTGVLGGKGERDCDLVLRRLRALWARGRLLPIRVSSSLLALPRRKREAI